MEKMSAPQLSTHGVTHPGGDGWICRWFRIPGTPRVSNPPDSSWAGQGVPEPGKSTLSHKIRHNPKIAKMSGRNVFRCTRLGVRRGAETAKNGFPVSKNPGPPILGSIPPVGGFPDFFRRIWAFWPPPPVRRPNDHWTDLPPFRVH